MLSLIDVIHCGYCGRKMTNGSKYNYWKIRATGEKRASKIPIYRCQAEQEGLPHDGVTRFRADMVESVVFDSLSEYIGRLQEKEDIFEIIERNQSMERKAQEAEIKKLQKELEKAAEGIATMEQHIPEAMTGTYALSLEELVSVIHRQQEKKEEQEALIQEKKEKLKQIAVTTGEWEELRTQIPTWQQVFKEAGRETQRVLVNKLIDRIDVTNEQIVIRLRF